MNRLRSLTARDRALAFTAGATALLVAVLLIAGVISGPAGTPRDGSVGRPGATAGAGPGATPTAPGASPTAPASPTAAPSPAPIESAPIVAAQPPPVDPPASAPVAAPVAPAATRPPATPTPSPDPNVWRVEGVLLDDATKLPIPQACVAIGPRGCQPGSVRTDDRGVFFIDVPQNATILYDFYFSRDGYWTVWLRIKPEGPSVYNLALTRR